MLHEDSRDYMAFQTTQGMYRPSRLVQGATNSVAAFVRISRTILNSHLRSITEIFVENVGVKCPQRRCGEQEVDGLPAVRRFVMEQLQNLDKVPFDVERAGDTIAAEKSDWCWNGVKIVGCVCGDARRWQQPSKVDKVKNWPRCDNRTECKAFSGLFTYYQIWIHESAIVAGPLF